MASPKSSKKKVIAGKFKLHVAAGSATPAPPIGPALGQRGLNIMEFCKSFNDQTKHLEKGTPMPVLFLYYADKKFDFIVKLPTVTWFLKKKINKQKGAKTPNKGGDIAGTLTVADCAEIAKEKMADLNANDLEAATRIVMGSARSMGIKVEGK